VRFARDFAERGIMNRSGIQEQGESSVYTCMLWNVQSGRPTLVTIHDEQPDRWIGRRCMVATSSFEAPLEMFMKSEWRRGEPPQLEKPQETAPTPDTRRNLPRGFYGFHP
jgi:hypothetical protein